MIRSLFAWVQRKITGRARNETSETRAFDREKRTPPGLESAFLRGFPGTATDRAGAGKREIDVELEARLKKAILGLPEELHEVVTLSRYYGLTHAEIARRTGRSEAATRMLLHRALVKLARSLS